MGETGRYCGVRAQAAVHLHSLLRVSSRERRAESRQGDEKSNPKICPRRKQQGTAPALAGCEGVKETKLQLKIGPTTGIKVGFTHGTVRGRVCRYLNEVENQSS